MTGLVLVIFPPLVCVVMQVCGLTFPFSFASFSTSQNSHFPNSRFLWESYIFFLRPFPPYTHAHMSCPFPSKDFLSLLCFFSLYSNNPKNIIVLCSNSPFPITVNYLHKKVCFGCTFLPNFFHLPCQTYAIDHYIGSLHTNQFSPRCAMFHMHTCNSTHQTSLSIPFFSIFLWYDITSLHHQNTMPPVCHFPTSW